MSTTFRITQSGKPTPLGGLLGAMGMTSSSDALDIVAETDDLVEVSDIAAFIESSWGAVTAAYVRLSSGSAPTEAGDDESNIDHDEAR